VVVKTMSTNPINIKDNYDIMDFELSDEQMKQIDELTKTNYRIVDESLVQWCPNWD
jgi:diketogulonate reductase-like aldo/keto reductase